MLDSNNKDIGECVIGITKKKSGSKIYYEINGSDIEGCPTTSDLGE